MGSSPMLYQAKASHRRSPPYGAPALSAGRDLCDRGGAPNKATNGSDGPRRQLHQTSDRDNGCDGEDGADDLQYG